MGRRQEAADGTAAAARRPELADLQRHAALEQPCCCQRRLVRLCRHHSAKVQRMIPDPNDDDASDTNNVDLIHLVAVISHMSMQNLLSRALANVKLLYPALCL